MKRLAIATHTALIDGKEYDGIGNIIKEALSDYEGEYFFIRHSMDGLLSSKVLSIKKNKILKSTPLFVFRNPSVVRYLAEYIATVIYFSLKKTDVFIGVDPLNALAGATLKKLGRTKKTIFFTPDHSPKRFDSDLLNNAYHKINEYCVKSSDEVWSVSTRIQEIRRQMGLPEEKNILVPNVPPAKFEYLKKNNKNKYILTTNGILDKQLDFKGLFLAMQKLIKKYPKLELIVIGNGPEETNVRKMAKKLGLEKHVRLLGRKTLPETLEETSKAGIGLALYTGDWGFNHFGDSTKCREYLFFGLPVISTDSHSTVDEIKKSKAGVIVKKDSREYVAAINEILENYDSYSKNATALGQKYSDSHKNNIIRVLS